MVGLEAGPVTYGIPLNWRVIGGVTGNQIESPVLEAKLELVIFKVLWGGSGWLNCMYISARLPGREPTRNGLPVVRPRGLGHVPTPVR